MKRSTLLPAGLLTAGLALTLTACSPDRAAVTTAADRPIALAAGSVTRDGTTVLASERVGGDLFLVGRRGSDQRFAASFDGSDPNRNWDLFDPEAAPSNGMSMGEVSNFPDAAPGGLAVIAGAVGRDVVSIDVRTHAGGTEQATLAHGLWIAAWNGRDFDDRDTLDTSFVLHLKNGTTRTVTYLQLSD